MRVSLQLLAFQEPNMRPTLDAWGDQPVPGFVTELSREAWVTPSDGRTMDIAREHPGFTAYEAPAGKLPARNAAHDSAMRRGYDAIVVFDADAPPLGEDVLARVLRRLREPDVAAVNTRAYVPGLKGVPHNAGNYFKTDILGGLNGQCHALSAEAWRHAGPFRDVDDASNGSVWKEEEYAFAHRVRGVGRIVTDPGAKVYNDPRRFECLLGIGDEEYCERLDSQVTFDHSERWR